MKKILLATALALLFCLPGNAQFIGPLTQSITFTTVAPPSNTPLLGSSLSCTGSAGSFSSGTFLVAYTYTGTDSNSESKASSDASGTLVVTCSTNGTLTIPSPPPAPGCFNCVGWRPYVIASASGTNAELLQTITSTNCSLASTSSLTACAIGSSFTETSLGAGAGEPSNPSLFTSGSGGLVAQNPLNESSLLGNHVLFWTTTGTAASCSIAIQTGSTQNGSFSTMTNSAAQTCTSSGSFQVSGQTANFVRLGPLTFTATGANTPSITITLISTSPPIQPDVTGKIDASSAPAGRVGEVLTTLVPIGSEVSLSTGTAAVVASVSLTAGDWDVAAVVNLDCGSCTTVATSTQEISINTGTGCSSPAQVADGSEAFLTPMVITTSSTKLGGAIPLKQINVNATTTVCSVATTTFSAGTMKGWGVIIARRRR